MRKIKMGLCLLCSPRFRQMGEDTPASYEVRQQALAERIVTQAETFCEVCSPGLIFTREDVCEAMDLFWREKVDFVLCSYLSWAEDFAWIRFLRDMYPTPLLIANILPDIPYQTTDDENDFVQFLANGGLVGALEGSGSVERFARPMTENCVGTLEQVLETATRFGRAASVRQALRECSFGLLNSYNEVMWSTYLDPYLFFQKAGPELRFLSVSELEDAVQAIPKERVATCIAKLTAQYPVRQDVDDEKFAASVRASLALEDLAVKSGVSAMVLNDVGKVLYERIGLRPGFCPTPDGPDIPIIPEGDLGAGLAIYILRALTGAHVNMIEPFYIDQTDGTLVVGHAGPNDYRDPNGKTLIARDVRFAKTSYRYAGAPFAWHVIAPGEKTLVHLSQDGGTLKLVTARVQALPETHALASYTHGRLRTEIPVEAFCKALLDTGVTQHYGLAPGDCRQELRTLAGMLGFSYREI